MKQLQKLTNSEDSKVKVKSLVTPLEIADRSKDYGKMSDREYATKHSKGLAFRDIILSIEEETYNIQLNVCINPFCCNFGLPQHNYEDIRYKPSRYKVESGDGPHKFICNDVDTPNEDGIIIKNKPSTLSNWSAAEEIKRLVDVNSVAPVEPEYAFHRNDCPVDTNPFDNPEMFRKRGKSSSNSEKLQCKECDKITNVMPAQRESYSYHQQRNDVLVKIFKQILNRTPVSRTLEILDIGASTYYNKLKWLHRKCIEFLIRHEVEALKNKTFDTLWLETDKFHYNLNDIRKKGFGGKNTLRESRKFATHIVATVDSRSRYAFRTDIAYDCNVVTDELIANIRYLKEDKLHNFAQRNARYRYAYYRPEGKQKRVGTINLEDLSLRSNYVDGLHVKNTYTAYAQYWLLRRLLNAEKINYITDEDSTLITALMRANHDLIKAGRMDIFTCTIDKSLSRNDAFNEYIQATKDIKEWIDFKGMEMSFKNAAIEIIANDLYYDGIYDEVTSNGKTYPVKSDNRIRHPYPHIDEGIRYVNCLTDLSSLDNLDLAALLYKVDMRAVNTFFNQIRRRASILERPLVSGRGEGKSYIYSNYNPKYAHYTLTLIRTYLNFCQTFRYKDQHVTPAMLLGIAKKPFEISDIVYFT